MNKNHSRGDQGLNRRDFLRLTSMAIPGALLVPNIAFSQEKEKPILEYFPEKEGNIYFKFVSPENIPDQEEIKIQNITPETLNNLKKSNPYQYTPEQISQTGIKGLEQKAIALGEIRPLSEKDKDYVLLGINRFASTDDMLNYGFPGRGSIIKKNKIILDIYIPKEYISSFSYTTLSITIHFCKEIKITNWHTVYLRYEITNAIKEGGDIRHLAIDYRAIVQEE